MEKVLKVLRKAYPELSASKKRAVSYLLNNYPSFYMDTVQELADKIGVSDTTIINLCSELGFQGYSGFKRTVREEMTSSNADVDAEDFSDAEGDQAELRQIAKGISDAVTRTLCDEDNQNSLIRAKSLLGKASKIYFVGFWTYSAVAKKSALYYLHHGYLTEAVYPDMGDYIEHLQWVPEGSVAVVFDFARYVTALTEICTFLKEKGIPIILITDNGPCPRLGMADAVISCLPESTNTFPGSQSSVVEAVLSSLLSLLRKDYPKHASQYSNSLRDAVFTRFNTYGVVEPSSINTERI